MFAMIIFWSLWFFVAALSNICDFFVQHELLPAGFVFRSGNLMLVHNIIAPFGLTHQHASFFVMVGAFIELIVADCFFMALLGHRISLEKFKLWLSLGFSLSISLWMSFLLMCEIFVYYQNSHIFVIMIFSELGMWVWIEKVAAGIRRTPKPRKD